MSDDTLTTFDQTLERLDIVANLKVGDRWPPFLSKTGDGWDWAPQLSNLTRCAAAYMRSASVRIGELLAFNNEFEERARQAERAMKDLLRARPIEEYIEDYGDVLWWKFPIEEPPYVGRPGDCGITVEAHTNLLTQVNQSEEPVIARFNVGGWPGYHTHWTPLPDANRVKP